MNAKVEYPVLYRGSVKDLRGPVSFSSVSSLVFDYTDAYSVFDWGRMPDPLPEKGAALATIAAHWFEKLERSETWKDFSKSPDATRLRKGNRFGSSFNEIGEELQSKGLRTHYLGVLPASETQPAPVALSRIKTPVSQLAVRAVNVVRPELKSVLGRQIPDYGPTRQSAAPKLVPLEVIFRFGCPSGSSLFNRVAKDPDYLASIGFSEWKLDEAIASGAESWSFPVLELFTKLESMDRPLSLTEAIAISGLTAAQMQRLLLSTAWVAGWLRSTCSQAGVELADGKLEWGIERDGSLLLVDAIGPDELRLLKDGVQLSKEFLRMHYRETPWYKLLMQARELGRTRGVAEWKKFVGEPPPALPPAQKQLGSQLYMALANALCGRNWFEGAWTLPQVVEGIREQAGLQ